MNITSNVSNPSFTAKMKRNDILDLYVNNMNKDQMNKFANALEDLNKVSPGDTIELIETGAYGDAKGNYSLYSIANKDNHSRSISINLPHKGLNVDGLINIVKNIATKNTEENNQIFYNKKETNEILDMLA